MLSGVPILSDSEMVSTLPIILVPLLYFFPFISKSCCATKGIVEPSNISLVDFNCSAIFICIGTNFLVKSYLFLEVIFLTFDKSIFFSIKY